MSKKNAELPPMNEFQRLSMRIYWGIRLTWFSTLHSISTRLCSDKRIEQEAAMWLVMTLAYLPEERRQQTLKWMSQFNEKTSREEIKEFVDDIASEY